MDRAGNNHSESENRDSEKQAASLFFSFIDVSFKSSAMCVPAEGVPIEVKLELSFCVLMILEQFPHLLSLYLLLSSLTALGT